MVVIAVGGAFYLVSSQAAPKASGPNQKFKGWEVRIFKLAAANYWNNPKRIDQGNNARAHVYDINSPEVTCKPGHVKLRYIDDPNNPALAFVGHWAKDWPASQKFKIPKEWTRSQKQAAREWHRNYYCKIYFNLAYKHQFPNVSYACVTFIHEYGHMLGREHNNVIDSPMSSLHTKSYGNGRESFDMRGLNVLKRSLCDPLFAGRNF